MSHVQSPLSSGAGTSRARARALLSKRAGLGLLAPALAALALGVAPAAAQAVTTGSISGTFTVPAGTVHPSDVNIQLADRNGDPASNQGNLTVTNTSATTASYTITGVSPGQYYLYFNDTATADNVAPDYYGDGGADNITKGTVVTVPATGGTQALNAETLTAGAIIAGTVTDANAASETATHVTAVPNAAALVNDPMLPNIRRAVSAGIYKIAGLPADTFSLSYDATGTGFNLSNVWVDGSGLTYDYGSGTQYAVTAGNTTAANFSVPAVGGIGGTVTAATGGALPGVGVSVYDATGNIIPPGANTAADGTYTVSDVLPGSYEVQFAGLAGSNLASSFYGGSSTLGAASKVTVSSGATTPSINGSLGVGATISGTVTAAQGGAALGGLPVEVLDAQGNVVAQTTTNPNGTYTLNDVPAGTWYLEFVGGRAYNGSYYATEYYLGMSTLGGSLPIKLTAGETLLGVNEALHAGEHHATRACRRSRWASSAACPTTRWRSASG